MITGCFSLVSQAISLDFTPPLRVIHSSKRVHVTCHCSSDIMQVYGQVYVPVINFLLMIISILIVIGFRTSAAIANAYGVTVSGVSLITTVMFCKCHLDMKYSLYQVLQCCIHSSGGGGLQWHSYSFLD
jgi:KUP system potassium uptake protein